MCRRHIHPGLLALAATAAFVPRAEAAQLRFYDTAAGGIVATGNTLGLSKELDRNGPGTEDSIGTFTSLINLSVDSSPANLNNPWFGGTTNDWTLNGSEARLVLSDDDVEVLYAELLWGGSTYYDVEDVTGDLDSAVTLSFGTDSDLVAPDPLTALTIDETSAQGFPAHYYMRSADVTEFVSAHGQGMYSVEGVPATQDSLINSLNAAGWTLVVAYRDSTEPIRNLTMFVGGSFVDEDSVADYSFSGFCTPPSGAFDGTVAISAVEGDANLVGDSLAIAETELDQFVTLSGPNNPADNFFCSQINDSSGHVDTSGTFGDRNHDAQSGVDASGARQSWDVTQLAISSMQGHLSNGQTEAVIRTQTTGDSFVPILAAFAIGVNAPDFSGDATNAMASPTSLMLDEQSTVTIDMQNVGLVAATGLVFRAPLPDGLDIDSFSIDGNPGDVDGNAVDAGMLAAGVPIGDVGPDVALEIQFVVHSVGDPPSDSPDQYVISPEWDYDYVSCVGEDPLTEPYNLADVVIDFVPAAGTTGGQGSSGGDSGTSDSDSASGSDGSASVSASDTATASATATATGGPLGGTDSDSAGQASSGDGCGCRTRGDGDTPLLGLAMVGLLGLLRRRRS